MPRTPVADEFTVGGADDGTPAGPSGRGPGRAGHPGGWVAAGLALIVVGMLTAPTLLPRAAAMAFAEPVPSLQISVLADDPLQTVRYGPLVGALDDLGWSGAVACTDPGDGVVTCVRSQDGSTVSIDTRSGAWSFLRSGARLQPAG
ncbi:hypothetical protein EXU48_16125 [Occultella glacieicola]|uniref:Uncharacterized protein n=1 Tax=Occultella glacieicola TaxID=2518684 RepID=A0ABY2E133_9MICO|nr:hypothetical protein [Occultella glacieicola]TDE91659.1 hypothetical protein EXU48_16125 [Occultella glacieicola]